MRLIDADALLSKYLSNRYKGNILIAQTDYAQGARDIIEDIIDAPTIEPEQKKGKWVLCENPTYSSFHIGDADPYLCTVCYMKNDRQTKYCPNCGAKMEEE